MVPLDEQPTEKQTITLDSITDPHRNLLEQMDASDLGPPLSDEEFQRWTYEMNNLQLPDDLISLYRKVNGFTVGDWMVEEMSSIHEVIMDEKDYMIIAEHSREGVLAFVRGNSSDGYYKIDYEGMMPESVGFDFLEVLASYVKKMKGLILHFLPYI